MKTIHILKPSFDRVKGVLLEDYHEQAIHLLKRGKGVLWLRLCSEYQRAYFPSWSLKTFMSKMGRKPKSKDIVIEKTGQNGVQKMLEKIQQRVVPIAIQLSLF